MERDKLCDNGGSARSGSSEKSTPGWQRHMSKRHSCTYTNPAGPGCQMSLNSSISWPEGPLWFCPVAGSTGSLAPSVVLNASLRKCERLVAGSLTSLGQVLLLEVFLVFFWTNKSCFVLVLGGGGFHILLES